MCACVGAAEQRLPQPVRAFRDDTGKARKCESRKGRKERLHAGSQTHELLVAPRDGVQVPRTQLKTGRHRARRAVLSAPCLANRSAGVGCAPRKDLRQEERRRRGRWVLRELSTSPTLLGLVRGVLSMSCWGSGWKGDWSRRARRAWAALACPDSLNESPGTRLPTCPQPSLSANKPADALSRCMQRGRCPARRSESCALNGRRGFSPAAARRSSLRFAR